MRSAGQDSSVRYTGLKGHPKMSGRTGAGQRQRVRGQASLSWEE